MKTKVYPVICPNGHRDQVEVPEDPSTEFYCASCSLRLGIDITFSD